MIERDVTLENRQGMHARPASLLVERANRHLCEILIRKGDREVNAKSILGVLTLGAACGETVTLCADGADREVERRALDDLHALFRERFYEE